MQIDPAYRNSGFSSFRLDRDLFTSHLFQHIATQSIQHFLCNMADSDALLGFCSQISRDLQELTDTKDILIMYKEMNFVNWID